MGGLLRGNEDSRRSEKNLLTRLQIRGIASQLHNWARRTLQCKKMPDRIKPVESGYVVAAHVNDVHSLFRGRMPRRREDRSKRARRLGSKDPAREDTLHSPFEGRKPQRRVDTSRGRRHPWRRIKNSLTRRWKGVEQIGGRSKGTRWRSSLEHR
jgi:hypothetical protein